MAYKIINGKLAAETDKNYLDVSSSKRDLFDALKNQVQRAEAAEARAAALEDTLQKQLAIRDDLVIRVNELEAERDEAQRVIATLQGELNKALAQIAELERETRYFQSTDYAADQQLRQFEPAAPVDWREELERKLAQAQRRIEELETTLRDIATAPYENQPNDGDEWEKEYYLRGMHRP